MLYLKNKFKVHLGALLALGGVAATAIALLLVALLLIFFFAVTSTCEKGDEGGLFTGGGSAGSWTQPGSAAYKRAQTIFDTLTKQAGFSGAGGAGGVAVAVRECGPSINEKAKNAGGGVAGVFQWSGWGNKVNGNRIETGGFIKAGDDSTLTMDNEMKLLLAELKGGYHRAAIAVGHATDPAQAALDWSKLYEGVSLSDGQTKSSQIQNDARTAYKLFGGENIQANDSLLGISSGTASLGVTSDQENTFCQSIESGVSGKWGWPFKGVPATGPTGYEDGQQFGHTGMHRGRGNFHDGYDWGSARYHGDILAVHGGKVYKIAHGGARDWYVDVKSSDGYYETYQECFNSRSDIVVNEGDEIKTGQKIGTLDTSHLHLGISKKEIEQAQSSWDVDDGTWLNPIEIIKKGLGN